MTLRLQQGDTVKVPGYSKKKRWNKYRIPASIKGQDSIVECDLVNNPDFSDLEKLTKQIEARTERFIQDVEGLPASI